MVNRKGKQNVIVGEIETLLEEVEAKDKEEFLISISSIIRQLDTDMAIDVMEEFGDMGYNIATGIKINEGY